MRSTRPVVMTAAGALALALCMAAPAWACNSLQGPSLSRLQPDAAPAGSAVTVSGAGFDANAVAIRWDSATGPELASATGPRFSVQITIPDAAAGNIYKVYAVQGNIVRAAPFEVRRAEAAPSGGEEPAPPSSGSTETATSGSSSSSPASGTASPRTRTGSAATGDNAPAAATNEAEATPAPGATPTERSTPQTNERPVGPLAPALVAPTDATSVASGPEVIAAPASAAPAAHAPAPDAISVAPAPDTTSVGRGVMANLWSGYNEPSSRQPVGGLLDLPARSSASPFGVSVGLLSIGLVALFVGFAGGEVVRRTVVVSGRR